MRVGEEGEGGWRGRRVRSRVRVREEGEGGG